MTPARMMCRRCGRRPRVDLRHCSHCRTRTLRLAAEKAAELLRATPPKLALVAPGVAWDDPLEDGPDDGEDVPRDTSIPRVDWVRDETGELRRVAR